MRNQPEDYEDKEEWSPLDEHGTAYVIEVLSELNKPWQEKCLKKRLVNAPEDLDTCVQLAVDESTPPAYYEDEDVDEDAGEEDENVEAL